MAVQLPCKQSGCRESVTYEREVIPAVARARQTRTTPVVVYLKCPAGHEHPYEIPPPNTATPAARET
jgi:hypothetical protein